MTLWNDTYEEEKVGNASSNNSSSNAKDGNGKPISDQPNFPPNRVRQLQAGQLAEISPSKALPLNINIPVRASPNKFLPDRTVEHSEDFCSL